MLGAIGSKSMDDVIVFEVSEETILTLDEFARTCSVRFAKNDVLLKKPVSQYIGPDLDKITFKITLKAQHGVNPKVEMDKLIILQRDGSTVTVLIGKALFGVYRWTIAGLEMTWKDIDNQGTLISAVCNLTLEEYV